jgi:glycosyltransferase involved in cell wall biosynthesis
LLLALGRRLRRAHGIEIAFLLLDGGAMEAEYAALAPLAVARDAASVAARIADFAGRGFAAALVNSAAASRAVPVLCRAGLAVTLLVHELPRLLRARALVAAAREAAQGADAVVFPHPVVRDAFLAATGAAPACSIIRPQGLYCPSPFVPEARARVRASLGVSGAALLALGVGHGDLRKGFDLFLQAWRCAQGAEAGEAMHFAWAGTVDATLREALRAELTAAEASGTFHLPGFCDDAPDWFSAADVHVLASREDPYPSVALEAMSAGLPTVAFAGSGGIPDLLAEYDAGEAVPLGDAAALAAAARCLGAASCANRARLARAAEGAFDFGAYAAEIAALARPGSLDVSVVVPSCNYARFLRERLASIFGQTWPVREVILLDDASADDSVAVAEAAAAEWGRELRVIASDAPSGAVFGQWRRAAELARGRLLWIAEADDAAEPGLLAALLGAMAAVPGAVMAFADSRSIDEAGASVGDSYKPYYRQCGAAVLVADGVFEGRDFATRHLAERNLILNASAVLWDRAALLAAFDRCGAELETFRMAGDWRLYLELLDQPDAAIAYVAEPLNVHRRHSASVTHRLDAERHVAEIARMQLLAAERLVADVGLRARQARVLDEVAATLGTVLPAPIAAPRPRPRLRSVG